MNRMTMVGMMAGTGLVAAMLALALRPAVPTDTARLDALERRLNLLENQAFVRRDAVPADSDSAPSTKLGKAVAGRLQEVEQALARAEHSLPKALERRLEAAVDERVAKLEQEAARKENKKPSLDVFAEVLGLNEYQRKVVDEQVWLGQDDVRTILEIPTADGSSLFDELVEAVALGEAGHPEAAPRFRTWLGRVIAEKIPGTEVTYGMEIDAAKEEVRAAFRQAFSEDQYAEFIGWEVDPLEIEEIENSPWSDFEQRVQRRVKELTR